MYTKEQLQEAIWKLPQSLQLAIGTFDTYKIVQSIGEQYYLHVDQVGRLSDEIRDTLLNLHRAADFKQNIINSLQISSDMADQIVTRVNDEIFLKIRELEKEEAEKERKLAAGEDEENEEEENEASEKKEVSNILTEKLEKVFSLPSEKADVTVIKPAPVAAPSKPWEQDPYLEKP